MDRKSRVHYAVTGQFADDGTFIVNAHTGEVYVTRPLDRDAPRGRPVWNFNVLAHDEAVDAGGVGGGPLQPSLTGYAEVRVVLRDLNDNAPVFDRHRLVGKVTEHSRAGEFLPLSPSDQFPYHREAAYARGGRVGYLQICTLWMMMMMMMMMLLLLLISKKVKGKGSGFI